MTVLNYEEVQDMAEPDGADHSSKNHGEQEGSDAGAAAEKDMRYLPLAQIETSVNNPRKLFEGDDLEALAQSIREHGVLQPIKVRPYFFKNGVGQMYQVIAGERRVRASLMAGLATVPAMVDNSPIDTQEHVLQALVENLVRVDLKPMELARGYDRLLHDFGMTQYEIAAKVQRQQPTIANTVRLLKLPESVQAMIDSGLLSRSHGTSLASLAEDPALVEQLARRAMLEELSASALEHILSEHRKARAAEADALQTSIPLEPEMESETAEGNELDAAADVDGDSEALEDDAQDTEPGAGTDSDAPAGQSTEIGDDSKVAANSSAAVADDSDAPPPSIVDKRSSAPAAAHPQSGAAGVAGAPPPANNVSVNAPKPNGAAISQAAPKLPEGWVTALVKVGDYERAQELGLWPLSSAIAALGERLELHPLAVEAATQLASEYGAEGDRQVALTPRAVSVLMELFPDALTHGGGDGDDGSARSITPEMVASALLVTGLRAAQDSKSGDWADADADAPAPAPAHIAEEESEN